MTPPESPIIPTGGPAPLRAPDPPGWAVLLWIFGGLGLLLALIVGLAALSESSLDSGPKFVLVGQVAGGSIGLFAVASVIAKLNEIAHYLKAIARNTEPKS